MSRRGNCYDNAAMESWFSTFKSELGGHFESASDARRKAFDYIKVSITSSACTRQSATLRRPSSRGQRHSQPVHASGSNPGRDGQLAALSHHRAGGEHQPDGEAVQRNG